MSEQEKDFPETIEFGGETWTKKRATDDGAVDYCLPAGGGYVHRYGDGSGSAGQWLGRRYMKFQNAPRIFDKDPGEIFDTQAEAMRYVLDLTPEAAIAEVVEWLVTKGYLEGSTAVHAGILLGRKQVFAEIENLKTAA